MPVLTIVVILVAVGVGLWLINAYIPMDAVIKKILNVFVIIAVVVWLMVESGLWDRLSRIHT